jgi:hypoxanthine phosphoribosyltransferase
VPMAELRPAEILLSEAQIQKRVEEMALEIRRDYPDDLHVIAVLKGAFIFLSDLARYIPGHVSLDFMAVSSYAKGTTSSGEVKMVKDLDSALDGRNVIIVEDIVDTGLTMRYLLDNFATRHPASVKICALLHKPSRARTRIPIQYLGFTAPDVFVVGYGLDAGEKFRNVPFIGVVKANA